MLLTRYIPGHHVLPTNIFRWRCGKINISLYYHQRSSRVVYPGGVSYRSTTSDLGTHSDAPPLLIPTNIHESYSSLRAKVQVSMKHAYEHRCDTLLITKSWPVYAVQPSERSDTRNR